MSGCHSKNSKQMCSSLKAMLGKIGNRYRTYCTVYKMHAMATHHRGAGCFINRNINLPVEDAEATGIDNDNESISGLVTTVALGGMEAEGNCDECIPSNQAKLTALTREINELCQWIEAGEGQPAEILDCIEWGLQNLSLALQPQLPPMPTPTEPFGEVICQYTNTFCTTQKQRSLINSQLQGIIVFNEYDWKIGKLVNRYRHSSGSN